MAIDVRQAVDAVVRYTHEFEDLLPTVGMRLEETIYDDENESWEITMSVFDNQTIGTRNYRAFTVDRTGSVTSMKQRNILKIKS